MKTATIEKENGTLKPLVKRPKSDAQKKLEALIIRDRKAQGIIV